MARYYLRALELAQKGEKNPQIHSAADVSGVTLEHIMPIEPDNSWRVSAEVAQAYYKRLGNTVLLPAKTNAHVAELPFSEKKKIFKSSPFVLTADTATYSKWGPEQIDERQQYLAEIAIEVWPL